VHPLIALLAAEDKTRSCLGQRADLRHDRVPHRLRRPREVRLPRINAALASRSGKIQGDLEHAELDRQEANRLLEEYRRQLTAARRSRTGSWRRRRRTPSRRARPHRAAEADANRVVARAQEEIRAERNRAIAEVRSETASLASASLAR